MLTVIAGSMYAGKSSMLLSLIRSNEIAGRQVVVFKPKTDTRCGAEITTHNSGSYPAIEIDRDANTTDKKEYANVVCFDEAQFFSKELIGEVEWLLINNYEVIVAGLCQDAFGRPFGCMPELLSMADNIIHLKAVCSSCKEINSATRTYRTISNQDQTLVGGTDIYQARCFSCWKDGENGGYGDITQEKV